MNNVYSPLVEKLKTLIEKKEELSLSIMPFDFSDEIPVSENDITQMLRETGTAAVVFHRGGCEFEKNVVNAVGAHVISIGPHNPVFSPLAGIATTDLPRLLLRAAPESVLLPAAARHYFSAMISYLKANNQEISLENLAELDYCGMIFGAERMSRLEGKMSIEGFEIKSRLMAGAVRCFEAGQFLKTLRNEAAPFSSGANSPEQNSISLFSAAKESRVLLFSLNSSAGTLFARFISAEAALSAKKGLPVTIFAESGIDTGSICETIEF